MTKEIITPKPRYWVFQANPNRYRIFESLKSEKTELWNLNQYSKDVHLGDKLLIWASGSEAGVYALGTVVSEPIFTPDSIVGQNYWNKKDDGKRPKPRVHVRYDRSLLNNPLLKIFIMHDPILQNMSIIQQPRGTNFALTKKEWDTVMNWISNKKV